jgi:hypothetical protein
MGSGGLDRCLPNALNGSRRKRRNLIRDGKLAAKAFDLAKQLRQYALDLEAATVRERKVKTKKLPREWWK